MVGSVDIRSLSIEPILDWILLNLPLKLRRIDWTGRHGIDSMIPDVRHYFISAPLRSIPPRSAPSSGTEAIKRQAEGAHLAPGNTLTTSLFKLCTKPYWTALLALA